MWTLSWTPAAGAQESPTDERARLHFESGSAYYDAGNYERALGEFESAYELSQRPALLYNLYLAHERLGHASEAADFLSRYLTEGEVPADRRPTLEERLTHLRERAEPPESPDTAETPEPEPPAPAAVAPADTEPAAQESSVSSAAVWSYIVGATGLVLAGVFGTLALVEHGDLSDTCSPSCTEDDVANLRAYDIVADVSLGVAVVGAALGSIFLATGGSDDEPEASAWLGPDGAGVLVRGAL